jgi:translation initiation factor IF-2
VKELNLLVKADVQGSAEAIKHALAQIGDEQLKVRLIRDGIGDISETDVDLAAASKAIIIGFNVKADGAAQRMASARGVDVRYYDVIYKLVDDIQLALTGLLEPVYREQVDGHAEVMQLFKVGRSIIIGGCRVQDGKITRGSQARVQRGGKVVWTGAIESLRRGKDDVREVLSGFECGIILDGYSDLEVGDIVEVFSKVRV